MQVKARKKTERFAEIIDSCNEKIYFVWVMKFYTKIN